MRPLFGFFQALTLPLGVYAHDCDFTGHRVTDPLLLDRIANAVRRGLPLVLAHHEGRHRDPMLAASAPVPGAAVVTGAGSDPPPGTVPGGDLDGGAR